MVAGDEAPVHLVVEVGRVVHRGVDPFRHPPELAEVGGLGEAARPDQLAGEARGAERLQHGERVVAGVRGEDGARAAVAGLLQPTGVSARTDATPRRPRRPPRTARPGTRAPPAATSRCRPESRTRCRCPRPRRTVPSARPASPSTCDTRHTNSLLVSAVGAAAVVTSGTLALSTAFAAAVRETGLATPASAIGLSAQQPAHGGRRRRCRVALVLGDQVHVMAAQQAAVVLDVELEALGDVVADLAVRADRRRDQARP